MSIKILDSLEKIRSIEEWSFWTKNFLWRMKRFSEKIWPIRPNWKRKGASRFELETCRSAVDCSTTELYALVVYFRKSKYMISHTISDFVTATNYSVGWPSCPLSVAKDHIDSRHESWRRYQALVDHPVPKRPLAPGGPGPHPIMPVIWMQNMMWINYTLCNVNGLLYSSHSGRL